MLVHSGCVPTVPAIGVPNSSAAEADPSWFDSQLPSWGSSLRLPRRFTGLCATLASPVSSDPLSGSCRNGLVLEECSGAAKMTLFGTNSTFPPLAVPHERSWIGVPASHGVFQPADQLLDGFRMLSA